MKQNIYYHGAVDLIRKKAEESKNVKPRKVYGFVKRLTDNIINNDEYTQNIFINSEGRSGLEAMESRLDLNRYSQFRVEKYGECGVLADRGDILLTVSGSGRTPSIISAMEDVEGKEIVKLLLTTTKDSPASKLVDYSLVIPGKSKDEEEIIDLESEIGKFTQNDSSSGGTLAPLGTISEINKGLALRGICVETLERIKGNDDKKCKAFFNEIDYFLKNAKEIDRIDDNELNNLIYCLTHRSGRVRGLGDGKSGLVNKSFMMRMAHLGDDASFWDEVGAKRLIRGDALVISSGSLPKLYINITKKAIENNGVDIFSFTGDANSRIFPLLKNKKWSHALLIPVLPDEVDYSEKRPAHIQPFKKHASLKPRKAIFESNLKFVVNGIIAEMSFTKGITEKGMKNIHD